MSDAASPAATPARVVEPGVESDGIDTQTLAVWGFISVVLTVSIMLVAAALFYGAKSTFDSKRLLAPPYQESEDIITAQQGVLTSYGPPSAEGKPYKIPVDRAGKLVLQELIQPSAGQ